MQTPSAERWPVHPSGHNKLVFKRLTIRPERWRSFFEKSLWGKRIPFSHRPGTNHRAQKRLSPKWGKPRVGLPGFEPGKTGPESVVLPLHHSPIFHKKQMPPALLQLGYQDSNLEKQDQNLLCYHYTIAHCPFCECKFSDLFLNPQIFIPFFHAGTAVST